MKKILTTIILLFLIFYIATNYERLMHYVMVNIVYHDEILEKENNRYATDRNWNYVKITDNFYPENKKDILNVFYTALNGGWDELTFYCNENYSNCLDDVESLTDDNNLLSTINNFVPTYNSYSKININMNNLGRVNIVFNKIYTDEMINPINEKVDQIYQSVTTEKMSTREKIKAIHDYIINHTSYDENRANEIKNGTTNAAYHTSNTAYGALINGKALCGGYTDAMALFLDKMNVPNYKIASSSHIWNYVYLDGKWLHLDLTWDDPVTNTGENRLEHNFFLITTEELEEKNTGQHNYDKSIYSET